MTQVEDRKLCSHLEWYILSAVVTEWFGYVRITVSLLLREDHMRALHNHVTLAIL